MISADYLNNSYVSCICRKKEGQDNFYTGNRGTQEKIGIVNDDDYYEVPKKSTISENIKDDDVYDNPTYDMSGEAA